MPALPVSLVLGSILALPAAAMASPGWPSTMSCTLDPEPGSEAHVSPLHDDQVAEFESYGHSYRLVGNKSYSRLETHSWVAFTFDDGDVADAQTVRYRLRAPDPRRRREFES